MPPMLSQSPAHMPAISMPSGFAAASFAIISPSPIDAHEASAAAGAIAIDSIRTMITNERIIGYIWVLNRYVNQRYGDGLA